MAYGYRQSASGLYIAQSTEQHQFNAGPFNLPANQGFVGASNLGATFFTQPDSLRWTTSPGWRSRYSINFEMSATLATTVSVVMSYQKATGLLPPPTPQQFAQDEHDLITVPIGGANTLFSQQGAVDLFPGLPGGPVADGDPLSVGFFVATGAGAVTIKNVTISVLLLAGNVT